MENSLIRIYSTSEGDTSIDVKLDKNTVWLNLNQLTTLFNRDKSVISRHIRNVFLEHELEKKSVVAKNATTAIDGKTYYVNYYNLDVIISIGYRIKSKQGTQFRIWANSILKDYLIKGFAINQQKLKEENKHLKELQRTIKILSKTSDLIELSSEESKGLFSIISDYSYALDILDQYDYQTLEVSGTSNKEIYQLTYAEAIKQIELAKQAFGNSKLFGLEKDNSFKSSVSTIYQSFNGRDLYPSTEEKAANLLYFIVKNHSFTDGNKRIAAFLFLYFLEKNRMLFKENGEKRIADNALVALTLMIAVSDPFEKNTMIKVIVNLINKNN